jgi:hypothetical protein
MLAVWLRVMRLLPPASARDEEAGDKEARDEEARDEEARDEEARDKEARDKEARDEEARDEEARRFFSTSSRFFNSGFRISVMIFYNWNNIKYTDLTILTKKVATDEHIKKNQSYHPALTSHPIQNGFPQ